VNSDISGALARAFIAFRADDAEPAVAAKAKMCLTDFLGNALGALDLPWTQQALGAATGEDCGSASILGRSCRATASAAAFANAVAGHGLVRDDMHVPSVSHLGVVVIPTVLAAAETTRVSGRALLDAIVVGYEAGGLLGRVLIDADVARVHRPTGTIGPFAAAAAAARLLGLDETAFAAALGLAADMGAGYNEWAHAGGTEMFFQPGIAARNALLAVTLARNGAVVSPTVLEGPAGMFAAYGKHWPDRVQPFTQGAEIESVFFKEVPACNYAQTAAQAARDLAAAEPFAADSLEEVIVRVPQAAAVYPGCDVADGISGTLQAKMSIQYNVAAALLTGHFDESNYLTDGDTPIASVAARTRLLADDVLTRAYPARQGAEVSVRTVDRRRLSRQRRNVAPASDETVQARFEAAATDCLGQAATARLKSMLDSLASLDDASLVPAECRIRTATDDSRAAS